jgi:hypothetical protein
MKKKPGIIKRIYINHCKRKGLYLIQYLDNHYECLTKEDYEDYYSDTVDKDQIRLIYPVTKQTVIKKIRKEQEKAIKTYNDQVLKSKLKLQKIASDNIKLLNSLGTSAKDLQEIEDLYVRTQNLKIAYEKLIKLESEESVFNDSIDELIKEIECSKDL